MDGLASLMQQAPQGQPQQTPQAPMPGMNPRMDNAVEVVNNDIENLNLDPRTEYALKVQEASDLLASAERNLAMKQPQPTPPEVVDQRKQQVQQRIQQGVAGLLQQLMPGMQQRGMQMAAMQAPRQAGLPTQAAPNMARMMDGGIVGYQEGGEIYDDIGAMAALYKQASDKLYDPAATPEEKANAQRQIDMINAQAGSRIGQVRRRVAEMSGTMDMEMAGGGYVKRYQAGDLVRSEGEIDAMLLKDLMSGTRARLNPSEYARQQEFEAEVERRLLENLASESAAYAAGERPQRPEEPVNPQDVQPMLLPPGQNQQDLRIADRNRRMYEASPERQAELEFEARRDLVTRARNLRRRMEAGEISQDAYNRDIRQIERELSNLTDINRSMQVPEAPEERMPLITPADASAELTRQITREQNELTRQRTRERAQADSYGRSIVEQFAGPRTGIMGGMPNLPRAEEPRAEESMLLPPGQNRQDQRIAALRTRAQEEPSRGPDYEDIANFLRSGRDYVLENPIEAAGYALTAFPVTRGVVSVGGGLLKWGTKLLTKYPNISTTLLGLGLINQERLRNIFTGEEDLPPEALEALVSTDLTQAGVDPADIAEGQAILESEQAAPDVADVDLLTGDTTEPDATGDTTEPAATGDTTKVDVIDELDAARREGREINWDSLISGLLAAGQGTSTATALGGYGMGSQAERRRQEALAIEREEADLERDLRREILGEESTIAREQMRTQLDVANARLTADLDELARRTSSDVRQDIIQNIRANADMNFVAEVDALVEQELRAIENDPETRRQYEALTGLSSRTWLGLGGPSKEFKELVRRTVEQQHLNRYLDKEEARITGAPSGGSEGFTPSPEGQAALERNQ